VGGKTGTTNDFRNAAFLGFAPVWQDEGYGVADGYALGVYVGYDDNRPLTQRSIRLAGSSGALPAWVGTLVGFEEGGLLGTPESQEGVEVEDVWALEVPAGITPVEVSLRTGLPMDEPGALEPGEPVVWVPEAVEPEVDVYRPMPRPPRLFPRTDEWSRLPEGERPRNPLIRREPRGP